MTYFLKSPAEIFIINIEKQKKMEVFTRKIILDFFGEIREVTKICDVFSRMIFRTSVVDFDIAKEQQRHYAIQRQCVAMSMEGDFDAQSLSDGEQNDTHMIDNSRKKGKAAAKTPLPKGSDEYLRKRARNNEAVRKSRVKSKKKIEETQLRVNMLTKENSELKTKVTLLSKELNVLRSLFANGGITIPENVTVEKTLEIDTTPEPCSTTSAALKSEPTDDNCDM